jgi:hypothetical protein
VNDILALAHLLAAVLASFRLTEIITSDRISDGFRRRYTTYLWRCQRCVSVWAGMVTVMLYVVFPWLCWPLAVSWLYITYRDWRSLYLSFLVDKRRIRPIAGGAACDSTLSPGAASTVVTAVSSAASGATICLDAGSYTGNVTFSSVKSSYVTVRSTNGSGVTFTGRITIGAAARFLRFQNLTVNGATIGDGTDNPLHIQFIGITWTDSLSIYNPDDVNADILIDSCTFINLGQSVNEGRCGVYGVNNPHNTPSGIVISHNLFQGGSPSGCSDGVQITGDAYQVQVLYNEFSGMKQGSCDPVHVDPIQFYGADAPIIRGNYFHGNSTGIMSAGANGQNGTFEDNVFTTDGEYPDQIVIGGTNCGTFNHNTFDADATIRIGNINALGACTNAVLTNNIIPSGLNLTEGQTTGTFTIDRNHGIGGTNQIVGTPTYVGGATPTTWAGWELTGGSPGENAGSDGQDIGTRYYGVAVSRGFILR